MRGLPAEWILTYPAYRRRFAAFTYWKTHKRVYQRCALTDRSITIQYMTAFIKQNNHRNKKQCDVKGKLDLCSVSLSRGFLYHFTVYIPTNNSHSSVFHDHFWAFAAVPLRLWRKYVLKFWISKFLSLSLIWHNPNSVCAGDRQLVYVCGWREQRWWTAAWLRVGLIRRDDGSIGSIKHRASDSLIQTARRTTPTGGLFSGLTKVFLIDRPLKTGVRYSAEIHGFEH